MSKIEDTTCGLAKDIVLWIDRSRQLPVQVALLDQLMRRRMFYRRQSLKIFSSMAVAIFALGPGSASLFGQARKILTKDDWMSQLMKSQAARASDSPLHLGRFREPMYYLLEPISWAPNPGQADKFEPVDVPKGFVSDLASIPRIFWSLLRPDGTYAYAAILHDYLYWTQTRPREQADEILKRSMEDFDVDTVTVNTIYRAVRTAGHLAWNSNARLKAAGEMRILTVFPANARTSWKDWSHRDNVFVPQ